MKQLLDQWYRLALPYFLGSDDHGRAPVELSNFSQSLEAEECQ